MVMWTAHLIGPIYQIKYKCFGINKVFKLFFHINTCSAVMGVESRWKRGASVLPMLPGASCELMPDGNSKVGCRRWWDVPSGQSGPDLLHPKLPWTRSHLLRLFSLLENSSEKTETSLIIFFSLFYPNPSLEFLPAWLRITCLQLGLTLTYSASWQLVFPSVFKPEESSTCDGSCNFSTRKDTVEWWRNRNQSYETGFHSRSRCL